MHLYFLIHNPAAYTFGQVFIFLVNIITYGKYFLLAVNGQVLLAVANYGN